MKPAESSAPSALHTARRKSPHSFASKRKLDRPRDLYFVVDTGAAAELAGPGRIASQFVLCDAHGVELLERLYIGNNEAA
jgi:hypothetical protein